MRSGSLLLGGGRKMRIASRIERAQVRSPLPATARSNSSPSRFALSAVWVLDPLNATRSLGSSGLTMMSYSSVMKAGAMVVAVADSCAHCLLSCVATISATAATPKPTRAHAQSPSGEVFGRGVVRVRSRT